MSRVLPVLHSLWRLLDRRQRRSLDALQSLSIAMAFSTVGGIAAVMPFFTVLSSPRSIHHNVVLQALFQRLRFGSDPAFVVMLGVVLAGTVLVAAAAVLGLGATFAASSSSILARSCAAARIPSSSLPGGVRLQQE